MYSQFKVLIVDGEQKVAVFLEEFLRVEGYEVDSTDSPLEALEMITRQKYHVILSDIAMAKMDGVAFLTRVKEHDALTQVIMMSGSSMMERTRRCLEAGANDYVLKPFQNASEVIGMVKLSEDKQKRWWNNMHGNFS